MTRPAASAAGRRTKLVCTIGPASAELIDRLVEAGMDVARVNFSHGTADEHAAAATAVRRTADTAGRPIAVMADLAGPKIRLGELTGGSASLSAGAAFRLRAQGDNASRDGAAGDRATSGAGWAEVSYERLAQDVRVGDPILLADGAVELRVASIHGGVTTEVVRGGTVRSRAGVAIPASRVSAPALTDKDLADIPRAIGMGATFIAQSFVRSAKDITALRRVVGPDGPAIVAKIETRPAVDAFDAILEVVDAVMIARGDLGVELPYEEVPVVQKQLVRRALERGIPSIVATQMLESMTAAPRPTRAEASDVANAVFDGADAVMLSGETAIGAYPIEATEAAVRILAYADAHEGGPPPSQIPAGTPADGDSIALAAASMVAADRSIGAVACYTRTGRTARVLAALRPRVPILAFSPDARVVGQLAVVHGVHPRVTGALVDPDEIEWLARHAAGARIVPSGTKTIFLSSTGSPGSAPNVLGVWPLGGR